MTETDDDYDGWDDDNACWNCGGEGRVNDCIDGCCVDQDNIYCEYCSHPCDVCRPRTKKQQQETQELRDILSEALNAPAGGSGDE